MVKPRDSTSDSCPSCDMYMDRIKELEEINELHRILNGELREAIRTWIEIDKHMKNDMEKK